jgi:hypothetical protein
VPKVLKATDCRETTSLATSSCKFFRCLHKATLSRDQNMARRALVIAAARRKYLVQAWHLALDSQTSRAAKRLIRGKSLLKMKGLALTAKV